MSLSDAMPKDRPQDLSRRFADLERTVRELQAALQITSGRLGNELLKSPVRGDVTEAYRGGFGLTTTPTTLASQTWDVPEGFTRLAAQGMAKVMAYNPTGALDYLYARMRIVRVSDGAAITGVGTPVAVSQSGGSGTSIGPGIGVIEFAGADQVRFELQGWTAFTTWATDASNVADLTASLMWLR